MGRFHDTWDRERGSERDIAGESSGRNSNDINNVDRNGSSSSGSSSGSGSASGSSSAGGSGSGSGRNRSGSVTTYNSNPNVGSNSSSNSSEYNNRNIDFSEISFKMISNHPSYSILML